MKIDTLENLILKLGQPKFCKIDVEGDEYQVLKGMKQCTTYLSFVYNMPEFADELKKCVNYFIVK